MKRAIRLTGEGGMSLGAAIAGALSPLVTFGLIRVRLLREEGGALLEVEGDEAHVDAAIEMAEAMVQRVGQRAPMPGAKVGEA